MALFFICCGISFDKMLATARFRLVYQVAAAVTEPAKWGQRLPMCRCMTLHAGKYFVQTAHFG